jgi:hypothetical protein
VKGHMGIEATGKVYRIDATQQVTDRFSKREFIVELADNPKYPQHVMFQCTGDRCTQLDDLAVGDEVRIEFSLRGRLYNSKKTGEEGCFNSLDCWKVERVGEQRTTQRSARGTLKDETTAGGSAGSDDEIPFASCDIAHEPNPIARVLR